MALNGQLRDLGARFRRATSTAPLYRLHALAGPGVARPGMIRVGAADGEAIAIEVWALDAACFGRFVAAIPPPLGIGTIELADGSLAKGFLAEPAGLAGATNITAFGGWRAYMAERSSAA